MNERIGVLIAVLSSALGGTAAAVTRYVVGSIDPVTIAAFRFGIGKGSGHAFRRIEHVKHAGEIYTAKQHPYGRHDDAVDQSTYDWHKRDILINPPGYAPAAFVLLAELHGRIGHFPVLVRLRPKPGQLTTYEVAELINLQAIREDARRRR